MADELIGAQLPLFPDNLLPPKQTRKWPDLHTFWQQPERLPPCVRASPTVMRNLELLSPLDWANFPERNLERHWGQSQIPFAALAAAELIKRICLPGSGRILAQLTGDEHHGPAG